MFKKLVILSLLAISTVAQAQSSNLYRDFTESTTTNYHTWESGWISDTESYTPMKAVMADGYCGIPGLYCHSWVASMWPLPQIATTTSAEGLDYINGTNSHTQLPPGTLMMRPDPLFLRNPVIRWTAPAEGTYLFQGTIQGVDKANQGFLFQITTTPVKTKTVDLERKIVHFSFEHQTSQSRSVDFLVKPLLNSNPFYATGALDITVTKIQ